MVNALDIAHTAVLMGYPSVADVRAGRFRPTGRFKIAGQRKGEWFQTEEVDAADVDWSRLLPEDRVVLPEGP